MLATAALALVGMAGPLATSASAAAEGSKVILLTVTDECSYRALHKKAFLEEAAKHGLEVEVKINNFDPAEQATQVDQALGEAPGRHRRMARRRQRNRAIAAQDQERRRAACRHQLASGPEYSKFWDAFTGPDDIGNGSTSAEALIEGFKERGLTEGNVFVIVGPSEPRRRSSAWRASPRPSRRRRRASRSWARSRATGTRRSRPMRRPRSSPSSATRVQGVYAPTTCSRASSSRRSARGSTPKSLVLVGHNCSIEGVTALENGTQYATVLQSPIDDGIYAAQAVANLLDGEEVEKSPFFPIR